ncbi:MAG: hypothetical protein K0S80_1100 [Neobacillus sp.]|nr:hypothetical protein [Neobacillus sp.]
MNTQYEERIVDSATTRQEWSNTGKFYREYREKIISQKLLLLSH